MGIAKTKVSINGEEYSSSKARDSDDGLVIQLKSSGGSKYFENIQNATERYYIIYLPDSDATEQISRQEFKQFHSIHWGIESYHRAIKQVCGIERFMVRKTEAIKLTF